MLGCSSPLRVAFAAMTAAAGVLRSSAIHLFDASRFASYEFRDGKRIAEEAHA